MSVGLVRDIYKIDIFKDTLELVCELPEWGPRGKGGKKINKATPFRWIGDGRLTANGEILKLPSVKVGGNLYTSREAFAWWVDQLSGESQKEAGDAPGRAYDRAERELDAVRVGV